MNEFFRDLGRRYVEEGRRRGADLDAPELDSALADELLDLARVVAQASERRFAPLSTFLAGVAVERYRAARPEASAPDLAAFVAAVRRDLELQRDGEIG